MLISQNCQLSGVALTVASCVCGPNILSIVMSRVFEPGGSDFLLECWDSRLIFESNVNVQMHTGTTAVPDVQLANAVKCPLVTFVI